jgi:hypothetical protein
MQVMPKMVVWESLRTVMAVNEEHFLISQNTGVSSAFASAPVMVLELDDIATV